MSATVFKNLPNGSITTEDEPTIFKSSNSILTTDNFGTVVSVSALSNISLTSVPDVIQDAINQSVIEAKDLALADDLLVDIRDDIDNLEDGVYNKTYIDSQITYLEESLIQKTDSETVAAIVNTKVAIATEDLVATSTIDVLSGRIGDSESSIASLAETVNTNDLARANQTNEAVAELESSLAAYSDVLELTVDENGNATSSKIETLQTDVNQNVVDITETKTIAQDANGKWEANAGTLITAPDGTLTGIHAKASDSISEVVISADKFKIENAITTPFSIDGTDIQFNGKVSFANNPSIATKDDLTYIPSVSFVEDENNKDGIELVQYGTKTNIAGSAIGNYSFITSAPYFTTEESYKGGAVFSWETTNKDSNGDIAKSKSLILEIIDTETDEVIFSSLTTTINDEEAGFIGVFSNPVIIEGLEEQFYENNPNATSSDYNEYRILSKDLNGNLRNGTDAALFFKSTFIYDNENFILEEEGVERFRVPTSSGRTLKVKLGTYRESEEDIEGSTDTKYNFSFSFNILKWEQYNNYLRAEDISWQTEVQDAINNNATTIDGGKIVTNEAFVNNLNATGGIVADTIVANSSIEAPIINGATFNGIYLSIEDIKVKAYGYPDNFGDVVINKKYAVFTTATQSTLVSAYSDVLINRSKFTGYSSQRLCSNSQIFNISCSFTGAGSGIAGYLYLYVSTDGGSTYSLLDSIENVYNISELALAYTYTFSGSGDVKFKASGKWVYPSSVSANVLTQLEIFTINT